jgi:hypothetical protein
MAGWSQVDMTGLTVNCTGKLVIKTGWLPAFHKMAIRTLTLKMIDRAQIHMAGLTIGCPDNFVVERNYRPVGQCVAG